MFHILGRFVFTSSFSRRSSPGFGVGPTRFGFCCCERGLLNVFTISVPIHPSFAIQSCRLGLSVAMFHDTHMGPFLRNHMLAEPGGFRTRTTLRQGKNAASEGGGLIGLCFRARKLYANIWTGGRQWQPYP